MSRLTIEITEQQHQSIKAMAALQGCSIKDYTLKRLFPDNDEDQALEELKALLAPRIARAERGEVSDQTVDEIVEEVLREEESPSV